MVILLESEHEEDWRVFRGETIQVSKLLYLIDWECMKGSSTLQTLRGLGLYLSINFLFNFP